MFALKRNTDWRPNRSRWREHEDRNEEATIGCLHLYVRIPVLIHLRLTLSLKQSAHRRHVTATVRPW